MNAIDRRVLAKYLGIGAFAAAATSFTKKTYAGPATLSDVQGVVKPIEAFATGTPLYWDDAFSDAMAEAATTRGFTLLFSNRIYEFESSILIDKSMHLIGCGASTRGGTTLRFVNENHGVVVLHGEPSAPAACSIPGGEAAPIGQGTVIESLRIHGAAYPSLPPAGASHGVVLESRATLRDIQVGGFSGDGIHIEAATLGNGTSCSNANVWNLHNIVSWINGRHGVFVQGQDANAGTGIAVDSTNNRGCGIYESSFLGNTWVGCHTASNGEYNYFCSGATNTSIFIGCYAEMDAPSSISQPAMIVGGVLSAAGVANGTAGTASASQTGIGFPNGTTTRSTYADPTTTSGTRTLELMVGGAVPSQIESIFNLHHNPVFATSLQYARASTTGPGWWSLVFANSDLPPPVAISTEEDTTGRGAGQLWLQRGCHLGGSFGGGGVYVTSSPSAPYGGHALYDTYPIGTRVLNALPVAGGVEGWVKCTDGIWREFGSISL